MTWLPASLTVSEEIIDFFSFLFFTLWFDWYPLGNLKFCYCICSTLEQWRTEWYFCIHFIWLGFCSILTASRGVVNTFYLFFIHLVFSSELIMQSEMFFCYYIVQLFFCSFRSYFGMVMKDTNVLCLTYFTHNLVLLTISCIWWYPVAQKRGFRLETVLSLVIWLGFGEENCERYFVYLSIAMIAYNRKSCVSKIRHRATEIPALLSQREDKPYQRAGHKAAAIALGHRSTSDFWTIYLSSSSFTNNGPITKELWLLMSCWISMLSINNSSIKIQ